MNCEIRLATRTGNAFDQGQAAGDAQSDSLAGVPIKIKDRSIGFAFTPACDVWTFLVRLPSMNLSILVTVLLLGFLALEFYLRKGYEAKSIQRGQEDRGSTILIVVAYLLAIFGGFVLRRWGIGRMGEWAKPIGVGAMVIGLLLRIWSMRTLGAYYTRTLRKVEDQRVVREGPYRILRHPGYLSALMVWVGSGLARADWALAMAIAVLLLAAYIYRIHAEEAMLRAAFGAEYETYSRKTWRLIPLVY